jgi:hypothetical protein
MNNQKTKKQVSTIDFLVIMLIVCVLIIAICNRGQIDISNTKQYKPLLVETEEFYEKQEE